MYILYSVIYGELSQHWEIAEKNFFPVHLIDQYVNRWTTLKLTQMQNTVRSEISLSYPYALLFSWFNSEFSHTGHNNSISHVFQGKKVHAYFTPTPPAAYLYFNLFTFSSTAELTHSKTLTDGKGKKKSIMVDPPIWKKKWRWKLTWVKSSVLAMQEKNEWMDGRTDR